MFDFMAQFDKEEIAQIVSVVQNMPGIYRRPTTKPRQMWEKSLVREFVNARFPTALQWQNARVGEIVDPSATGMFKFLRKWVDAIICLPDQVYVVEAKMNAEVGAISQLSLYMELFPRTPEFSQLIDLPRQGMLLTTIEDADVRRLCENAGHIYEVFKPSFFNEYQAYLASKRRRR